MIVDNVVKLWCMMLVGWEIEVYIYVGMIKECIIIFSTFIGFHYLLCFVTYLFSDDVYLMPIRKKHSMMSGYVFSAHW